MLPVFSFEEEAEYGRGAHLGALRTLGACEARGPRPDAAELLESMAGLVRLSREHFANLMLRGRNSAGYGDLVLGVLSPVREPSLPSLYRSTEP